VEVTPAQEGVVELLRIVLQHMQVGLLELSYQQQTLDHEVVVLVRAVLAELGGCEVDQHGGQSVLIMEDAQLHEILQQTELLDFEGGADHLVQQVGRGFPFMGAVPAELW
jgi:hypothetical protein